MAPQAATPLHGLSPPSDGLLCDDESDGDCGAAAVTRHPRELCAAGPALLRLHGAAGRLCHECHQHPGGHQRP